MTKAGCGVIALFILGLVMTLFGVATWAESGKSAPSCGNVTMLPGEVCRTNGGTETTYDEAVRAQRSDRTLGPILTFGGLVVLGGSIVCVRFTK